MVIGISTTKFFISPLYGCRHLFSHHILGFGPLSTFNNLSRDLLRCSRAKGMVSELAYCTFLRHILTVDMYIIIIIYIDITRLKIKFLGNICRDLVDPCEFIEERPEFRRNPATSRFESDMWLTVYGSSHVFYRSISFKSILCASISLKTCIYVSLTQFMLFYFIE